MEQGQDSGSVLCLGSRQRAAVAAALTILSAAVILASVLGLAWAVGLFLRRFSNVFLPLAVAAVIALVLRPYYVWLRERLRFPSLLALATVYLSILVPLVAFGWFFGSRVMAQVSDLVERIPGWWSQIVATIDERWPQIQEFFQRNPWGQRIRSMAEGGALMGLQTFGGGALTLGGILLRGLGTLLAWAVLPIYLSFFLMADGKFLDKLEGHLPFLKPRTREDVLYLVREFLGIVATFFRGQLIIAILQGLLFATGFSVIGLRYGFVLGLVLGFLNLIPYLGSIVGLAICLPLAYFQPGGGTGLVVSVLVAFAVVQCLEGYVLTPRIMGSRTGLHPMAIIFAVFFWGSALSGILGLILAIPLTAFLVVFWRLAREKYVVELF